MAMLSFSTNFLHFSTRKTNQSESTLSHSENIPITVREGQPEADITVI